MADKNLIIPEYKIILLNKNKKIIKKYENLDEVKKMSAIKNYSKSEFMNKKYNKNYSKRNKYRKRYNYISKPKKNNFDYKKVITN